MHKKILFFFFWSLLSFAGLDNELKPPAINIIADIESQGLCFMKDKDGIVWIGTYVDGLFRFDGKTLKHFASSSGFITSNNIPAMLEGSDGLLWFVSNGGGLTCFNKETNSVKHYTQKTDNTGLNSNNVYWSGKCTFIEDHNGDLWLGTIGGGLNKFNKKQQTFSYFTHNPENPKSISSNNIRSIYEDPNGIIWVGTEKGLNKLMSDRKEFIHFTYDSNNHTSISGNTIKAIYMDSDGFLWVGTESQGLNRMNTQTDTFERFTFDPENPDSISSNHIIHIMEDTRGLLWLSQESKFTLFDRISGKALNFAKNMSDITMTFNDPSSKAVWTLFDSGKIGVSSPYSARFNVYRPEPGNSNSLSSEIVITIYEDSFENLWIATINGLNKYNRKTGIFTHYFYKAGDPTSIPATSGYTPGLYEDKQGNFWIGSSLPAALSLFDRDTGKVVKTYVHDSKNPDSIPDSQQITQIMEDSENPDILWLASFNGLVKFNKKTENAQQYGRDNSWNIYEDHEGNIWTTTWGDGIGKFNKESETFVYYKHDPENPQSISDNLVVALFVDSKDRMWVGSENGLNLFNRSTEIFTHYARKNGYEFDAVHSIGEDRSGHLWLGTNAGLVWFNPENGDHRVFTKEDGIQGLMFYANNGIITEDGEMWFGGTKGMNSFFPEKVLINSRIPEIRLSSLKQGGEEINFGKAPEILEEIKLDWNKNYFEFEFMVVDYTNPAKNSYAYMLEGVDNHWFQAGHKNFGRYAGLAPGTYFLKLKGSNNDGTWNNTGKTIKVVVTPPWWDSTLFKASIILVVLIIAALYYQSKRNTFRKIKESEDKFRTLFESSMDAILLLDPEKGYLDCNQAALNLFKIETVEEFKQMSPVKLSPETQPDGSLSSDKASKYIQQALEKGSHYFTWDHQDLNERVFPATVQVTRVRLKEKYILQGTIRDKTDEIRLEEQLRQSQKMESIGQLAGGIAHDFNNLLTGILGSAEMLSMDHQNDAESMEFINQITTTAERAGELTHKLLAFSRKAKIVSEPISIHTIVWEVHDILKRSIDKSIELDIQTKAEQDMIMGDYVQIQSTILNLSLNARDAMPQGGRLTISSINLDLDDAFCSSSQFNIAPGSYIQINVTDTGKGIPVKHRDKIFEPFFTTKEKDKGTGLGLAAVYGTVKDHQGAVHFYSEEDKGTVFKVYLPVIKHMDLESSSHSAKELVKGSGTILIVDDEEIIRNNLKQLLIQLGYNVKLAANGNEALQLFNRNSQEISLVILDLIMPEKNGRETFMEMKQIDPNVKVLLSSGFNFDTNTDEMVEMGIAGFIQKPYHSSELSKKVSHILQSET